MGNETSSGKHRRRWPAIAFRPGSTLNPGGIKVMLL